jgi:hypothetical protein
MNWRDVMLNKTLAAAIVALAVGGTAAAQTPAEQKGDPAKPPVAGQNKDANKRHDHARDHKQGAPASTAKETAKVKKKPLHDHRKEHKQG